VKELDARLTVQRSTTTENEKEEEEDQLGN
jgi:hypothetical protein